MITIQERDGTAGSEYVVVRMRREHQNRLVVEFFEARILRVS
jgi:hypothetical protein